MVDGEPFSNTNQKDWIGRRKSVWMALVVIGLAIVVYGNIQLIRVAFESQPDCVDHTKAAGVEGRYRAAKSSC